MKRYSMTQIPSDELIRTAQRGDARAFEQLVNESYDIMFKMAFKWCGNRGDAEDITQEACIKLARGINSFRYDCKFSSWLYRLVINAAKDWYKSQNRHPQGDEDVLNTIPVEGDAESVQNVRQIWEQVYKLPDGEKEALLLVMGDGLSHGEAAKLLDVKESTISWRIHEARKKLEKIFRKEERYG